jgi:hypothetical protein
VRRPKSPGDALELVGLEGPEQMVLSDLVNRVLDKGVVISSHIVISVADVDLIELDLKLLLSSVAKAANRRFR